MIDYDGARHTLADLQASKTPNQSKISKVSSLALLQLAISCHHNNGNNMCDVLDVRVVSGCGVVCDAGGDGPAGDAACL